MQQEEIRVIATEMLAAGDVPVTALLAMGDLSSHIGEQERQARGEFASRFAAFASRQAQERYRALVAGAGS